MGVDHDRRSVRFISKAKRVHTSVYLSNSLADKRCWIPLVWKPQECPDPLCSPLLIGHHASQSCLVITGCSEHAPKVINSPKNCSIMYWVSYISKILWRGICQKFPPPLGIFSHPFNPGGQSSLKDSNLPSMGYQEFVIIKLSPFVTCSISFTLHWSRRDRGEGLKIQN